MARQNQVKPDPQAYIEENKRRRATTVTEGEVSEEKTTFVCPQCHQGHINFLSGKAVCVRPDRRGLKCGPIDETLLPSTPLQLQTGLECPKCHEPIAVYSRAAGALQCPVCNPNDSWVGNLCPQCGGYTLKYEEGCKKCDACGYSEC